MSTSNESSVTLNDDDNEEILNLLKDRLKLRRERYGPWGSLNDDTTQWGTPSNDWELMAIEEVLDGLIYSAAAIIRLRRMKDVNNTSNDSDISNKRIKIDNTSNDMSNDTYISNKRINKINNDTHFPFYM